MKSEVVGCYKMCTYDLQGGLHDLAKKKCILHRLSRSAVPLKPSWVKIQAEVEKLQKPQHNSHVSHLR